MRFDQRLLLAAALAPFCCTNVHAAENRTLAPVSAQATVKRVDIAARRFLVQVPGTRLSLVMITTSDTTKFQKAGGADAKMDDLVVGEPVWVEGPACGNNLLVAQQVILPEVEGGKAVMGKGTVTSVDAEAKEFLVQPENSRSKKFTVTLVKTTQFRKSDGSTACLVDLVNGLQVELQRVSAEPDLIAAQKIVLVDPSSGKAVSGIGIVVAADARAQRLVVQPQDPHASRVTVTLTEATQLQRRDNAPASLADLAIGTSVWIQGVTTSANCLNAQ